MKRTQQILELLRAFSDTPVPESFLIRKIGVPPKQVGRFTEALDELVAEGRIVDTGHGYVLTSQRREVATGRIIIKDEGFGFLVPEQGEGEDFYVPRSGFGLARNGDTVLASVRRLGGGRAEAFVQKVLERSTRATLGLYVGGGGGGYVIPENLPGVRRILIAGGNTCGAKDQQKVEVELPENQPLQETLKGRIVNVLGYPGSLAAERATLLRMHGFPLVFTKEAIAAAEALSAEELTASDDHREDLTDMVCCTIDPASAKDFDDAVTLEPRGDGWLAAVHIADVSHYVTPGSEIDREAVKRATSVYLPQGASPMLPEKLTGDICSLRPNERRRAVSVIFEITDEGEILSRKVVRSWIQSRRRFTYEEVQELLDEYDRKRGSANRWSKRLDYGIAEPWEARVAGYRWFARILREERFALGGLEFETEEVEVELDTHGKAVRVYPRPRIESYSVIEEWMLLANRTVTELFEQRIGKKSPFVYRVHEKPDDGKVSEFVLFAEDLGYPWTGGDPTDSLALQKFIHTLQNAPDSHLLNDMAIRSMMRAQYTTENVGHFGLGFDWYTHFTSPIRRYPDVMVHRLLIDFLIEKTKKRAPDSLHEELVKLCRHSSEREQAATEAEREGVKWKQVEYLERFLEQTLEAVIVAVKTRGVFIQLVDTLAQTFLPVDRLANEYLVYHPRSHVLRSRSGRFVYRLGDRIQVMVDQVDLVRHRVECSLVTERKLLPKVLDTDSDVPKIERKQKWNERVTGGRHHSKQKPMKRNPHGRHR
ncbi:MAG: ribonuclease R [bacterium]|nr:ribonuclease R [bacterium]